MIQLSDKAYKQTIDNFLKVNEIFIIYNNKKDIISLVTKDKSKLISFLLNGISMFNISMWKKIYLNALLKGLSKNTTKYRTFNKFTIIKYNYYKSIYEKYLSENKEIENNSIFNNYRKLMNKPEFIVLSRKEKIEQLMKNYED